MTRLRSYGYQPLDLVVIVFAAFCVVALLIGLEHVPKGPVWLGAISAFLLLAYGVRFVGPKGPRILRFLRDSYALWALPGGYAAAGVVNRAFTSRYFDDAVIRWEIGLLGSHPHTYLAAKLPYAPLSEFLHLCYYFYLWLLPVLGMALFFSGRERQFRLMATAVGTTFYLCFAFFVVFPVLGPYYTFERIVAPGSIFVGLVHRTLEGGAALGTAFPSSHCAAATAMAISAWRYAWRPLAVGVTLVAVGIVCGTVYGGFHYAIDSILGVCVGVAVAAVAPAWHTWLAALGGWREEGRAGVEA